MNVAFMSVLLVSVQEVTELLDCVVLPVLLKSFRPLVCNLLFFNGLGKRNIPSFVIPK